MQLCITPSAPASNYHSLVFLKTKNISINYQAKKKKKNISVNYSAKMKKMRT